MKVGVSWFPIVGGGGGMGAPPHLQFFLKLLPSKPMPPHGAPPNLKMKPPN